MFFRSYWLQPGTPPFFSRTFVAFFLTKSLLIGNFGPENTRNMGFITWSNHLKTNFYTVWISGPSDMYSGRPRGADCTRQKFKSSIWDPNRVFSSRDQNYHLQSNDDTFLKRYNAIALQLLLSIVVYTPKAQRVSTQSMLTYRLQLRMPRLPPQTN